MKKQSKFKDKGQSILGQENKPTGIGDFLDEPSSNDASIIRKSVNTDSRNNENTSLRNTDKLSTDPKRTTVRLEIRLDENLAEALRNYAFHERKTKKAVIVKILEKHLKKTGYLSTEN